MTTEKFELEKTVWTELDFDIMGWHDSQIYALAVSNDKENYQTELLFDIDYIFKWVDPVPPSEYFTFFVSPCTLVFQNVTDLDIDVSTGKLMQVELEISDLRIKAKKKLNDKHWQYEFEIETQQGEINFKATGFSQFVRKYPIHVQGQSLSKVERGEISFNKNSS